MVVAEITYSETGEGVCTIEHVEVDEALRGQGIAGKLVEVAVAEIKAQNKKVVNSSKLRHLLKGRMKHEEEKTN